MSTPSSSTGASGVRAATTLALWAAAWQAGQSADRVLAALDATGHRAGVRAASADAASASGLPGPGEPSAGTLDLLAVLRRGGPVALLLPVPGDVRGLPVGGDVTVPALDAGAAVVLTGSDLALVPSDGQWRVFRCGPPHATLPVREVTHLLDDAVAEATRRLAMADVASADGDPREAVRRRILADSVDTPPGTPREASTLLATSVTLGALLAVAAGHRTAAVTGREIAAVGDALRPLGSAVRESRRTAVAATASALLAGSARAGGEVVSVDGAGRSR